MSPRLEPSFDDACDELDDVAARFGVAGAIAGAAWLEALYPTQAAAVGLPLLRQLALARLDVEAAGKSRDPKRYREALTRLRALERHDSEASTWVVGGRRVPTTEEITALIDRARTM